MNEALVTRLAVAAAIMTALVLSGCGRKGPLDPPPSASATPQPSEQPKPAAVPSLFGQPTNDRPVAAPGRKRDLPMDVLLN